MRYLPNSVSRLLAGLSLAVTGWASAAEPGPLDWPAPTPENRPATIWWWLGSSVDRDNLTANLESLREAGMGGVTVVPIYGVKGVEPVPYLTPEWLGLLDHTVKEAERLGINVDMTTGTGWPFGGPMVSDDDADSTVVYKDGELGTKFSGRAVKRAATGGKGKSLNPRSVRHEICRSPDVT